MAEDDFISRSVPFELQLSPAQAQRKAAASAALFNVIYDNHHPKRCQVAMDAINDIPFLKAADLCAIAAMTLAQAMSGVPVAQRPAFLVGVEAMMQAILGEHVDSEAQHPLQPSPGVG